MITLSDDITVKLPTTGMSEGYVNTTISKKNTPVFVGHTYVDGNNSSVYINLNDIAVQNRARYDYLKLNDDGNVTTNAMKTVSNVSTRFEDGQITYYTVRIQDSSNHTFTQLKYVANAYTYPNKDIRPTFDIVETDLSRLIQGCDWVYSYQSSIGTFTNAILPHYPAKATAKYGFGLQLYSNYQEDEEFPYSLRSAIGNDISLGYTYVPERANQTFLSLADMVTAQSGQQNKVQLLSDDDTIVYLKHSNSDNDPFGHFVSHLEYKGIVFISSFTVKGYSGGGWTDITTSSYGSPEFEDEYLPKYITNNPEASILWDYDLIVADPELYASAYLPTQLEAETAIDNYENQFEPVIVEPWISEQIKEGYEAIRISPNFADSVISRTVTDYYEGNCPVAIMDKCYSRYYLAWNDRYGDIQSQAFDGKIEYSEDIDNNEIQDYKYRRRISYKALQPKWRLRTGWIKEDIYPYYESIFTSPYLLLYDTELDKSWNVILMDNEYKEKTYKNEKSLINLEILVEANTKQINVY